MIRKAKLQNNDKLLAHKATIQASLTQMLTIFGKCNFHIYSERAWSLSLETGDIFVIYPNSNEIDSKPSNEPITWNILAHDYEIGANAQIELSKILK